MKIIRALIRLRKKKYRYKYTYLLFYACGCKSVPHFLAKHICRSNRKELINAQDIIIDTYDRSGQMVHPDLVKCGELLYFVCTPYPYSIETYENPCVYKGNSVYDLMPFFQNPIARQEFIQQGNHISDPCIVDLNGSLNVFFRDTINQKGHITQKLYVSSLTDGKKWGKKKLILQSDTQSYISPAVVYNNEMVVLYYVQLQTEFGGDIKQIRLSQDLFPLEESVVHCRNLPNDLMIWHIAVVSECGYSKIINEGYRLIGLFTLRDKATGTQYLNYWAHCDSLDSEWVIDEQMDIPKDIQKDVSIVYKSAIIPETGDVVCSFRDKEFRWRLVLIPGDRDRQSHTVEKKLIDSYRIFSRVFHNSMSFERFQYKHEANPALKPGYYIQNEENGRTMGTNCFMGAHGCFGNVSFEMVQSCDTAVVSEARGKGIFSSLISTATQRFEQNDIDLMVGFPNSNSYHGFMKLGWKHIGNYHTMVKVLHPFDVVLSKFNRNARKYGKIKTFGKGENSQNPEWMLYESSTCPFDEIDCAIINEDGFVRFQRTPQYFNWKIDRNRDDFHYIVLRGERLKGYLLYRVNRKGRVLVTDWFADRSSEIEFNQIVLMLFNSINGVGNVIVMPYIAKTSSMWKLLDSIGFRDANNRLFRYPISKMIIRPLNKTGEKIGLGFDSWFVSAIDTDTVIDK